MILLPTLNRITKLQNFLRSAVEAETSVPGLIIVDEQDYQDQFIDGVSLYNHLDLPEGWEVVRTKAVTMGDKVREVWPIVKKRCRPWAMLVNDDHHIVSKNWDKILLSSLDGKNYVSANDRSPRTFLTPVTATAWSMGLLDALDWPIYPPGLSHLFIDDVWRELGKATGCWRIQTKAVVTHRHVLFGEGEKDATHNAVYGENFPQKPGKMWDQDQATFQNFMKHDFAATVEKIKKFQDHMPGQRFNPDYERMQRQSYYDKELQEG